VLWLGDDLVAELGRRIARARSANVDPPAPRPPVKIFATNAELAQAIALASPGAIVVVLARGAPASVDVGAALAGEVTIVGVAGAHPDLVPELAALVVKGELALDV
jgi:hypothetical protein